jgi:hypothetical protein
MPKLTKEEGVAILAEAKGKMAKAKTKEDALAVLLDAGKNVGYSPAFRCLVAGQEPDKSIKWE